MSEGHINIKTEAQVSLMREAGRLTYQTLELIRGLAKAGITTKELDSAAFEFIKSSGAEPSFLGYNGFPASICTSVNSQVVHGIPGNYRLKDGDILSVDVGVHLNGWHGDAARTFCIGEISPKTKKLVEITEKCFYEGIKFARDGYHLSDISRAIEKCAQEAGYGIVRELVGHGIGRSMHEAPEVPNFTRPILRLMGERERKVRLRKGMTLAIEPMINMGGDAVVLRNDGWTVETEDGMPSAHYENTIAITDSDPIILTSA